MSDTQMSDTQMSDTQISETKMSDTQISDIKLKIKKLDMEMPYLKISNIKMSNTKMSDTQVSDTKISEKQLPDLIVDDYAKFKVFECEVPPSDIPKSDIEIKLINKIFCTDVEIYLNGKLINTCYVFDFKGNHMRNNPAIIKKYNLSTPLTQLGISYFSQSNCRKCDQDSPRNYENIFYIASDIHSFGTSVFKPIYDKDDDGTVIKITTIISDDLMSFTISNNICEIYKIHERTRKTHYNLMPEYNKFGKQLWDRKYQELIVKNITNYIEFIDFIKSEKKKFSQIPSCEFQTAKRCISELFEKTNQIMENIESITPPKHTYDDFEEYNNIKTIICESLKIIYDTFQNLTENEINELIQFEGASVYYYMLLEAFNEYIEKSIKYIKDRKYEVRNIDISHLHINSINEYVW
jgi:hypothetical protein